MKTIETESKWNDQDPDPVGDIREYIKQSKEETGYKKGSCGHLFIKEFCIVCKFERQFSENNNN